MDYLDTKFPITAVAISEAGNELFSGGIDNDIKVSSGFVCLVLFFLLSFSLTKRRLIRLIGLGPPKTRRCIYYARSCRYHNLSECLP